MAQVRRELANRLTAAMLGNAKAVRELAEGDKTVYPLGTIIGKARGLSFRANPQDPETPSIALVGVFEGIPADPDRATIIASRCFLPTNVHNILVSALQGGRASPTKKAPPKGKSFEMEGVSEIPVMVEIGVRKSSGAVGYEFVSELLSDVKEKDDPLADMRKQLGPRKQLALPAPAAKKSKKR